MSALPGKPSGNKLLAPKPKGMNQLHTLPATLIGSPRKKAIGKSREARCQPASMSTNRASCQRRKLFSEGLIRLHISGPLQLLRIALEHFIAKHVPYLPVQFHKARLIAGFGHITRTWQVNAEL